MAESLTLPRPRQRATPAPVSARPAPRPPEGGSASLALGVTAVCALVLGVWLPISHYVLGYPFVEGAEDAFFNELLAGVIVGCAAYGRLQSPLRLPKLTALQAAAGAWLAAAPWLLGYAHEVPAARANDLACGVAAMLLAAAAAVFARRDRRLAPPPSPGRPVAAEVVAGEADLSARAGRVPHGRRPEPAGAR